MCSKMSCFATGTAQLGHTVAPLYYRYNCTWYSSTLYSFILQVHWSCTGYSVHCNGEKWMVLLTREMMACFTSTLQIGWQTEVMWWFAALYHLKYCSNPVRAKRAILCCIIWLTRYKSIENGADLLSRFLFRFPYAIDLCGTELQLKQTR